MRSRTNKPSARFCRDMSNNNGELADAVRQWVHFDNVTEHLNKQLSNVRSLRSDYETRIIDILGRTNMKHATLKVTGASLSCATRFKASDLTWSFLEEQLREYFKTTGKHDDTDAVVQFLQRNRGGRTIEYLKKTTTTPAIPPAQPPQPGPGLLKR